MFSRRTFLHGSFAGAALSSIPAKWQASAAATRALWLKGSWGLMVHWIAPGPAPRAGEYQANVNKAVNSFNIPRLVDQIAQTKASWLIFTVGQNTGYYASPNQYLDSLAGPGHTSERDLVLELAKALAKIGVRFIAYLPGEIKAVTSLHQAFGWNQDDQREFQRKYTTFIREYSERYGSLCSGWWIDGCYNWRAFPNSARDWPLWTSALRAGNPQAALAFNDGCFLIKHPFPLTPDQDFLSGEADGLDPTGPLAKDKGRLELIRLTAEYLDRLSCVGHVLAPIDDNGRWGHRGPGEIGPPLYSRDQLELTISSYSRLGIGLTMNVGIYQEGAIGDDTLKLLSQLR